MADEGMAGLSLVVAAHNEQDSVAGVIEEARLSLAGSSTPFEMIVIDDGSTDGTAAVLSELATRHPWLRIVHLERQSGKGKALRTGFALARNGVIAFADADFGVSVAELPRLLQSMTADTMVVGCRTDRRKDVSRGILSNGYRLLGRVLLGIREHDIGCPLKVFPKSLVEDAPLKTDGWVIDAELLALARRKGLRILEVRVPAGVERRPSSVRLASAACSSAVNLLKLRAERHRFRDGDSGDEDLRGSGWKAPLAGALALLLALASFQALGLSGRRFVEGHRTYEVDSALEGYLLVKSLGVKGRTLVLFDTTARVRDVISYEHFPSDPATPSVTPEDVISALVVQGAVRQVLVVVPDEKWTEIKESLPGGVFVPGRYGMRGRLFGAPVVYVSASGFRPPSERVVVWVSAEESSRYPVGTLAELDNPQASDVLIVQNGR